MTYENHFKNFLEDWDATILKAANQPEAARTFLNRLKSNWNVKKVNGFKAGNISGLVLKEIRANKQFKLIAESGKVYLIY